MSNLLFLLAAVVLSVVGCAVFLLRHRKPTSVEHGLASFSRQMQALAPDRPAASRGRGVHDGGLPARPPGGADPRR